MLRWMVNILFQQSRSQYKSLKVFRRYNPGINVISGAKAAPVSSEQAWCPQVVQPSFVSSVVPGRQLAGGTAFRIYQYDT